MGHRPLLFMISRLLEILLKYYWKLLERMFPVSIPNRATLPHMPMAQDKYSPTYESIRDCFYFYT